MLLLSSLAGKMNLMPSALDNGEKHGRPALTDTDTESLFAKFFNKDCVSKCSTHTNIKQTTTLICIVTSVSAFMALSTVFHSINSRDNSPLSHSVLPVSFLSLIHI